MHYRFLIICFIFISISSCSWISEKWDDRPSWVMPDKSLASSNEIEYGDYTLLSGININDSQRDLVRKLKGKNLEYTSTRDSMKDIKTYEINGSLFDNKNLFRYKNISAVVDFFDGDLLASRIFINAINTDNLDKIITVTYGFLIDFYQEPTSESSIYSFKTYVWEKGDIEIFLLIDREKKSVVISEINSVLEDSRAFKEFKDKYIEEYQTYEDELKSGKNRNR